MRQKFKKWAEPLIKENSQIACFEDDLSDSLQSFLDLPNLNLEIGCGKGMFAISMCKKFPEQNFLIIEKVTTVAGICLKEILKSEINNIYLICGDFEKLYDKLPKKFNNIFLNHPDPWPKKRHEKRRLTSPKFLNIYKNLLNKDGKLIFKTDNLDLFNYTIEKLNENNWFLLKIDYDYKQNDEFDAYTNYQLNFISKNIKINRLIAKTTEEL